MFHVDAANEAIALQDGEHVIAVSALRGWHKDLDTVIKIEHAAGAETVADQRIERAQKAQSPGRLRDVFEQLKKVATSKHRPSWRAVGALDRDLLNTIVEMVLTPCLGLGGADCSPKPGNVSRGRKAQPVECTATGPIHHGVFGRLRVASSCRNNPCG